MTVGVVVVQTPDGPQELPLESLTDEQLAYWAALGNDEAAELLLSRRDGGGGGDVDD